MLEGSDLSHWQLPSQQLGSFIIPKATQGGTYKDPSFWQHINYAKDHGRIASGGYHFLTPDYSGAAQADFYMSVSPGPLGILDWETNPDGRKPSQATAQAFLDRCKSYGRKTMTYAVPSDTARLTTDVRWPASLTSSPPSVLRHGDIWQYTWSPIDRDRFNGSLDECKALFYGTAPPTGGFLMALTDAQQKDVLDNTSTAVAALDRLAKAFGIDPSSDPQWLINLAAAQKKAADDAHNSAIFLDRLAKQFNIDPAADKQWLINLASAVKKALTT